MTKTTVHEAGEGEVGMGEEIAGEPSIAVLSYEVAFGRLEEILTKLESDDLPLHESLTLYERGAALVDHCTHLLDSATLRVQQWQNDETTTAFSGWQEG